MISVFACNSLDSILCVYHIPQVTNHEKEDEMAYKKEPSTVFQQFIRLKKHG